MNQLISELVSYGIEKNLVVLEDKVYVINRLLELFQKEEFVWCDVKPRNLCEILKDLTDYAVEKGFLEDDTVTYRDLFDTKIMGILTPAPSVIRAQFSEKYAESAKSATDFFYQFSKDTNYIRTDRVVKDEKWVVQTEYGDMVITINLSKPEKDPRDIARAAKQQKNEYPKCLLCLENEGYAGHISHPARQNHRLIPLELRGQVYYLQYSPYVYYNEHCIVFNAEHTPMRINANVFVKLLEFVKKFPHYMVGSNADLPIVGGSILSHDHFQGGAYTFAMAKAPYEYMFEMEKYKDVTAGIIKWPMSVIRLQSKDADSLINASNYILEAWRGYTDEDAFIYSETEGMPHNTITPIARMRGDRFEMDLVLRNNITTPENPWGVYHPAEKYHHIKKENIGLIEVMGLAVLPARLQKEIEVLADAIIEARNLRTIADISKHADWVEEWSGKYQISSENIMPILKKEIGDVFVKVLECAGVFKRTEQGELAFKRFLAIL